MRLIRREIRMISLLVYMEKRKLRSLIAQRFYDLTRQSEVVDRMLLGTSPKTIHKIKLIIKKMFGSGKTHISCQLLDIVKAILF